PNNNFFRYPIITTNESWTPNLPMLLPTKIHDDESLHRTMSCTFAREFIGTIGRRIPVDPSTLGNCGLGRVFDWMGSPEPLHESQYQ
ncbi:hypothetical protein HAX54_035755, partial [Datura stramonium]|nr:hypothetical protein [Datura stramonium]